MFLLGVFQHVHCLSTVPPLPRNDANIVVRSHRACLPIALCTGARQEQRSRASSNLSDVIERGFDGEGRSDQKKHLVVKPEPEGDTPEVRYQNRREHFGQENIILR